MQVINAGYRSLSFLINLNLDRFFAVAILVASLWMGGLFGTLTFQ